MKIKITGDDELALEIERKFLVFSEHLPLLQEGQYIVQGYLSEKPSIRYRFLDDSIVITIKETNPDGSRFEFETLNPKSSSEERSTFKRLSLVPPIEKIRYRIPFAGLTWEIDVYQGENKGLITVDVEFPEIGYPLQFPKWVDRQSEITQDPKFFNINLGKRPYSMW
ncbi:adenylate cyclase [Desulfosporosinus sp. OT]|uniref:CYTH domain-containing protein n=1 Tax=Desulfosporosinus sp. OT TaxID=913865 RepID=UPI001FA6DE4C|nr:adenylate cyclase [Desulfosporosinus sp. OT]